MAMMSASATGSSLMEQQQQKQQQPSSRTVKRHPNAVEPTRAELLKYLACLEGELAARDAAVSELRSQRQERLLEQARCGRYGLADPFAALQRDSEMCASAASSSAAAAAAASSSAGGASAADSDFDEAALKCMYDSQLAALENLIDTQRRAQQRMREQMALVERRYRRVCSELDDERRKHERDSAEGDDVLAGLEKERERLRSEVEYERQLGRKLDKEAARVAQALAEERALSDRQRRAALALIRDRRSLAARLKTAQHKCQLLEHVAAASAQRAAAAAAAAAAQSPTTPTTPTPPAAAAVDEEKAGLVARLDSEQRRGRELAAEVDRLRALLAAATHPASQPGGLLKVKPEPPVRRTPVQPQPQQQSPSATAKVKPKPKPPQQQQQQHQQVCAINGK